jgi:hypothetical protein
LADLSDPRIAGTRMAVKRRMMVTTTNSSMRVNPEGFSIFFLMICDPLMRLYGGTLLYTLNLRRGLLKVERNLNVKVHGSAVKNVDSLFIILRS